MQFYLPETARAKLEVFNIAGQRVATLADREFCAGWHSITWDASSMATGVYMYRLTTATFEQTRKMILLR